MLENLLEGKLIYVTGGSKGIGLEIGKELIRSRAKVVLLASSSEDIFRNVNRDLVDSAYFQIDMNDIENFESNFERCIALNGSPDILINNAGVAKFDKFVDIDAKSMDWMMNVNFKAPFYACQRVLNDMLKKQSGSIVNILSIAVQQHFGLSSIYTASKSALRSMSNVIRKENREKGIKVMDVLPGAVSTDIWSPDLKEKWSHKMMTPQSLAKVVVANINLLQIPEMMIEEMIIRPQGGDL